MAEGQGIHAITGSEGGKRYSCTNSGPWQQMGRGRSHHTQPIYPQKRVQVHTVEARWAPGPAWMRMVKIILCPTGVWAPVSHTNYPIQNSQAPVRYKRTINHFSHHPYTNGCWFALLHFYNCPEMWQGTLPYFSIAANVSHLATASAHILASGGTQRQHKSNIGPIC